MEEILTAEQVAQILQVHPFTVLKFIKQGKLKASKLGRVYRIRKSDVDEFLDNLVEQKEASSKKTQKKNNASRKVKIEVKEEIEPRKEEEPKKREEIAPRKEEVPKKREVIAQRKEGVPQQKEEISLQKEEIPQKEKTPPEKSKVTKIDITEEKPEPRNNLDDIDHYILELKTG